MGARPVLCIGALHVDVKARVSGEVAFGSSNPATFTRTVGGVACNVARNLARLGVPVALASVVGDDEAGRDLVALVAAEGIDTSAVTIRSGAATATYTAILAGDGSLVLGLADMAIYEDFPVPPASSEAEIWFLDANPAPSVARAVATAAAGRFLALDPVSVDKAQRIRPALSGAAVVMPDAGEAEALTGSTDPQEAARRLVDIGVGVAVVTLRDRGVVVADSDGVRTIPAIPAAAIVDETGAGDAFAGAYLAALATGEADPIRFGLAGAAITVGSLESVAPDLDLKAIRALI